MPFGNYCSRRGRASQRIARASKNSHLFWVGLRSAPAERAATKRLFSTMSLMTANDLVVYVRSSEAYSRDVYLLARVCDAYGVRHLRPANFYLFTPSFTNSLGTGRQLSAHCHTDSPSWTYLWI
jgi:hypothetical protein